MNLFKRECPNCLSSLIRDDLKKNQEKLRKYQKALLLIIEEGEAKGQGFREAINLARIQLGKIENVLTAMNAGNN